MADADPGPERSEAMRSCAKHGCRWPAAATLSYRYGTAEVWLSDLAEDHPSTHDLCPHHADVLTVPRGWRLVDDRRPAEAVREPSAAELVERVTQLRRNVDAVLDQPAAAPRRESRYAGLLADLPTYDPPDGAAGDAGQDASDASDEEGAGAPGGGREVAEPHGAGPDGAEPAPATGGVRTLVAARRAAPAPRPHVDGSGPAVEGQVDVGGQVDVEGPDGGDASHGRDDRDRAADEVHETGLRGAVVVQLPLRGAGWDDA